jgi:thymidylate synthase
VREDNVIFRGNKFYEVWLQLLTTLAHANRDHAPRGKPVAELTGVSVRLDNLRYNLLVHPDRGLNYRFCVAEWLWIALGRDDLAALARYNPKMTAFSDDGLALAGAYGPRLHGQWRWALDKLRQDPDTRQAVCSIWTPAPPDSLDIPCTLSFQYLLREGKLNCVATMRSSDAWLGLPYDVFAFAMLANGLAGELGVEPGWLQVNIGSSHLYLEHEAQARKVLARPELGHTVRSPRLPHAPRAWMGQWLDRPLVDDGAVTHPWHQYRKVLMLDTSVEALDVLKDMPGVAA